MGPICEGDSLQTLRSLLALKNVVLEKVITYPAVVSRNDDYLASFPFGLR